jgi:cryptochrome
VSLIGQLHWREFFYAVAAHTKRFDSMLGNELCKKIDWEQDPAEEKRKLDAWRNAQVDVLAVIIY